LHIQTPIEKGLTRANTDVTGRGRWVARPETVYHVDGCVWQLFRDPAALMAEMTSLVAQRTGANTATPAVSP
jgi:hypothetical protein